MSAGARRRVMAERLSLAGDARRDVGARLEDAQARREQEESDKLAAMFGAPAPSDGPEAVDEAVDLADGGPELDVEAPELEEDALETPGGDPDTTDVVAASAGSAGEIDLRDASAVDDPGSAREHEQTQDPAGPDGTSPGGGGDRRTQVPATGGGGGEEPAAGVQWPAPMAKVSDDPDDWRSYDHLLADGSSDQSWERVNFRTSRKVAYGLSKALQRRKNRLREAGGGEGLRFAAVDRNLRKVLSLQLLHGLPLDDIDELERLVRLGNERGWFIENQHSTDLELTLGMRRALDTARQELLERGLTKAAQRHLLVLAVLHGIDLDEPVAPPEVTRSKLEALLGGHGA